MRINYGEPSSPEEAQEIERRKIMDRLLTAEFGGKVATDPPGTPPDQWEDVLGEPIDPDILAKARKL